MTPEICAIRTVTKTVFNVDKQEELQVVEAIVDYWDIGSRYFEYVVVNFTFDYWGGPGEALGQVW